MRCRDPLRRVGMCPSVRSAAKRPPLRRAITRTCTDRSARNAGDAPFDPAIFAQLKFAFLARSTVGDEIENWLKKNSPRDITNLRVFCCFPVEHAGPISHFRTPSARRLPFVLAETFTVAPVDGANRKGKTMKKLVWLSATLTVLIVLAAGLTGAPPSDADDPTDESAKAAPSCCLDKVAAAEKGAAEKGQDADAKPACCFAAQGVGAVLAKTDAENSSQCKDCLKPSGKGGCSMCAAPADETAEAAVAEKVAGKACPFCNEDECKQQCKDCAAAQTGTDAAAAKQTAPVGKGMAMRGGPGMGRGAGMGRGHDAQHDIDHEDFFFLIEHKDTIRRTVKNLPNGIETLTESNDEDVAARIQKHVESMYDRMENVNPIRMRDPLFREIFANAKKVKMDVEHTEHGVLVRETSEDAYVAKLLQEHAKVVSLFIKNGYSELPKNHAPPKR